jgi:hypothetical protein
MGPSIETPSTRRRNGEADGQHLPSGRKIGTAARIRDMGTFRENETNAGRLPQSILETNDKAVHPPRPENEGEWITLLHSNVNPSLPVHVHNRKDKRKPPARKLRMNGLNLAMD